MFILDIESLGIESDCAILSVALIHFEPANQPTYKDLLDEACFVKLNAKDQVDRLDRTVCQDTLEWWKKIHPYIRQVSFDPSPDDLLAEDGIAILKKYIAKYPDSDKKTFWTRGSLDQMAMDSLCVKLDIKPLAGYNMYRDVRTAIDCFSGSTNGYCTVDHPTFQRAEVIKHHPVHDCALDAMMLMYWKEN